MNLKHLSLRIRIFISMILLILVASVLIAAVTIYQYKEQTKEYNIKRFGRKEEATKLNINLELTERTTYVVETKNLPLIYKTRIYDIAKVHKLDITMFDLEGKLLKSSVPSFENQPNEAQLSQSILKELENNPEHRFVDIKKVEGKSLQSSYTYLLDTKFKPLGILKLQYLQDNTEQERELEEFLYRLGVVYLLMFLVAITFAYFISSYIMRSIKAVTDKISQTALNKRNEKIILKDASSEIYTLVTAYNSMIDDLEESAVKLAKSEREQAWREMAKQVAHEIKNPLTPMRLSVQSFERKFDPDDPLIKEKLKEYSQTLIQQIDVMSSIASAFSDFAKMPVQKTEELNVVEAVKLAIDIFHEDFIHYITEEDKIFAHLDKTQLTRILTNLLTNAMHAVEDVSNPYIEVKVSSEDDNVVITVSDNGRGVSIDVKELVFEPKFTTKTSGMGLGLPMIKNIIEAYGGTIYFTSKEGKGTIFTVTLPKN